MVMCIVDTPRVQNLGTAQVLNFTQFAREGVAMVNHPIPQDTVRPGDAISVTGATSQAERVQWTAYGDLYDDGSVKRIRAEFPVELAASEQKTVTFEAGSHGVLPTGFVLAEELTIRPFELRVFDDLEATQRVTLTPGNATVTETGHHLQVWQWRERIPGGRGLWVEFKVEALNGMVYAPFTLQVGHHDLSLAQNFIDTTGNGIVMRLKRAEPLVRWGDHKIDQWVSGPLHETGYSTNNYQAGFVGRILNAGRRLGHGQSTTIKGVLAFNQTAPAAGSIEANTILAERTRPIMALSDKWVDYPELWTATNQIGTRPSYITAATSVATLQNVATTNESWTPADDTPLFEHRLGMRPEPGGTGDMNDFGNSKLYAFVREGVPHILHPLQRDVYQESCRPSNFRETDLTPLAIANHPNLYVWNSQPLCNDPNNTGSQSPDQLGRLICMSIFLNHTSGAGGQRWWDRDRQHYSINFLYHYAMATGDRWATQQLNARADLWLGEYRDPDTSTQNLTLASPDSPRGIGRGLRSGAQIYMATGRADVLDRIKRRLVGIQRFRGNLYDGSQTMSTLGVKAPSAGNITRGTFITPWEDGIAVAGLYMANSVTGDPLALEIAKLVARSQVMHHGWLERTPGDWQVAKAMLWNGGEPLSATQLAQQGDPGANPDSCWNPADGTAFRWWASPVPILGRAWAIEAGDSAWQTRCEEIIASLQTEFAGTSTNGQWPDLPQGGMMFKDFSAIGPVDALSLPLGGV